MTYRQSIGVYATHVFHYEHVVQALQMTFDDVRLVRRYEVGSTLLRFLERVPGLGRVTTVLKRREARRTRNEYSTHFLGAAQFLPAVAVRWGIELPFSVLRFISRDAAQWTSWASRGSTLLHFTDALGFAAIQQRRSDWFIVEKRSLHHSVFALLPEPIGGFPVSRAIKPVHADVYDIESRGSHAMIVYSNVAKDTFVAAGFNPRKIYVVPLPTGKQLPRVHRVRDANLFCYVGRGDVLKGLDVAVEAVGRFEGTAKLHVAGPMTPAVLSWLETKPWVSYLGILDKDELRELYSKATALVLPSAESFSLVAVEAAHHGLHVVCSDLTGASEYLKPSQVTVVQGRRTEDWVSALTSCRLFDAEGTANFFSGENSELSSSQVSQRLADVYRAVIADSNVPGLLM